MCTADEEQDAQPVVAGAARLTISVRQPCIAQAPYRKVSFSPWSDACIIYRNAIKS